MVLNFHASGISAPSLSCHLLRHVELRTRDRSTSGSSRGQYLSLTHTHTHTSVSRKWKHDISAATPTFRDSPFFAYQSEGENLPFDHALRFFFAKACADTSEMGAPVARPAARQPAFPAAGWQFRGSALAVRKKKNIQRYRDCCSYISTTYNGVDR